MKPRSASRIDAVFFLGDKVTFWTLHGVVAATMPRRRAGSFRDGRGGIEPCTEFYSGATTRTSTASSREFTTAGPTAVRARRRFRPSTTQWRRGLGAMGADRFSTVDG